MKEVATHYLNQVLIKSSVIGRGSEHETHPETNRVSVSLQFGALQQVPRDCIWLARTFRRGLRVRLAREPSSKSLLTLWAVRDARSRGPTVWCISKAALTICRQHKPVRSLFTVAAFTGSSQASASAQCPVDNHKHLTRTRSHVAL